MARRYNVSDFDRGERPTSGPVSLAGLIKLQPNQKKSKSRQSLQPNDAGAQKSHENDDFDQDDLSSLPDVFDNRLLRLNTSRPASTYTQPSSYNTTALQVTMSKHVSPVPQRLQIGPGNLNENDRPPINVTELRASNSPGPMRSGVVEDYTRIFGKRLPDLIHLHEEVGEFDGQVVFIGHPNRDVTAHQWSSRAFQWVVIGKYSYAHGKLEGSLASDGLKGADLSHDSIEYFKFAAERREKLIKEYGRQDEGSAPPSTTRANSPPRPELGDMGGYTSLPSASVSTGEQLSELEQGNVSRGSAKGPGQWMTPASRNLTRDILEDPFVTPSKTAYPEFPPAFKFKGTSTAAGSMDFNYEFPMRSDAAMNPNRAFENGVRQPYMQREREQLGVLRGVPFPPERATVGHLREVEFGEETIGERPYFGQREFSTHPRGGMSPEDIHDRQKLKSRLAELSDQARGESLSTDRRVAIPLLSSRGSNLNRFFPPGLTIANPYPVTSTLNAQAEPYTQSTVNRHSEDSISEVPTTNAPQAISLQISDPDGIRVPQIHDVSNGLGQQAPTRQNFKGPFFADSMPTTNDLTASLSFHVSDEDKLTNWFHDGQRPSRQQEYANSLMVTSIANAKARNTHNVGTIGDAPSKENYHDAYKNTPAFVRLYENLSEYVEESRGGYGTPSPNYFTRAWRPAPLHLRDLGPDGNNSFFSNTGSTPLQQNSNKDNTSIARQNWVGLGPLNTYPTNRYRHGNNA